MSPVCFVKHVPSTLTAVYLYREDITDQPANTRVLYERLKVLAEKGKEFATVHIPYEPGSDKIDVQGRTIHQDGTVIPLTDKPSDLVDVKTKGFQVNSLVFTLPDVDVGSILEIRVTIKFAHGADDPTWMIQQPLYVHKAHYSFKRQDNLFGLSYVSRLGADAKVVDDKKGTYTLDISDVPPLPDEDWMPPLNTLKWRVSFFYSTFASGPAYWESAGHVWADFVNEFTKPTGTLKKAIDELVAPGDTETQKAKKIYAAVMKLENIDFTRHKSQAERKKEKIKDIHNAQDVWKERSGNSDEIALLFVALCRAAGLNVGPMKVVDRNEAIFDEGFLSSRQMDDYIAVGQLDGKEMFFDPGERMCPFGMLQWKHTIASGFRLASNSAMIARTPAASYKASYTQRIADLTVDESGAVNGTVRVVLNGQDALRWRQIALENDPDEVKKEFNEWMHADLPEGVQAEFDHFLALDQYDGNLVGAVKVTGTLGTATGKHFFLPGLFFESKAKHPFAAQEKRTIPVDVHYARSEEDDVTYHLPAGYQVESGPKTDKLGWPEHAAFSISTTEKGTDVNVVRNLAYNYTILGPKDYGDLHDFYQKVAEADQEQLVLTRQVLTKAN
jgi:polyhydroxyalkanoate synthesis regulator phasin